MAGDMEKNKKKVKEAALERLRGMLPDVRERLKAVDSRLEEYVCGVSENGEGEQDTHNLMEVLGVLKFLRIFQEYPFEARKVQQVYRWFEGKWDNHRYLPGTGGLKFSGMRGMTRYELTPIQVFIFAWLYGPHRWVNTGQAAGSRQLLPSEEERDGSIWDKRRLVTEANIFVTRKFGKTMMAGFIAFVDFMFGDVNSEVFCCANAQDQAKLVYAAARQCIEQLDPTGAAIRFTATEVNWRPRQPRQSKMRVLSAGGKTKDGLFASLCLADEFGSAEYVKEKSDMANLVETVKSSMGPRREPLTVITTTAGNIANGPYKDKMRGIEESLLSDSTDDDWQMAVLLEPDEWERDAESLFTKPNIWRKVNPHIGVTVQNDYYEQRIRESRNDSETKKETITKLFNVWQSERVTEWVKPEDIAGLQIEQTIDDLDSDDGWEVYTGFDFSMGDDIYAVSYLATRWNDDSETQEFFADMDAWVAEEEMLKSPLRRLYERWRDEGWLHVVPGAVFPTSLFLDRVAALGENLHMVAYGFDPYKSKQPVNDLSAWVLSEGANPKECVIPVRQNFANYNSLVLEMDTLMRTKPALISFSKNPLWQWEFGNARIAVSTDGMENRKVVKSSDAAKVDNVQALMNALYCFDMIQGRVS